MSASDLQAFERLRRKLATASAPEQKSLVARFMAGVTPPLTAGQQAVLLYRGRAGQDVRVLGDWNGYREPGQKLAEIANSGLYFIKLRAAPDARLDYLFVVNPVQGGRPRLDPRNPRRTPGGLGARSALVMPGYEPPRELADDQPVPEGQLTCCRLSSRALGQRRKLLVYTPPGYPAHAPYPAVYLHDGSDYIRFGQLPWLADRLIAAQRVPPFIAVCMPPRKGEREIEYDCNDAYVQFVAEEAAPFIERRWAVEPSPARRAVMGASYGGLISLYIGLRRPDVFGLVGGQSAYVSRKNSAIVRAFARAPRLPLRFHLIAGLYETRLEVDEGEGDFLQANRKLAARLRKLGYDVEYAEYPEGHSWGLWKSHIGDALNFFWG